jgi:hypothetical protein
MPNRFWVGAGTWNGTNTVNWSATSGGAGGASIPLSTDDVYFDANSGNCTVTTNIRSCNNLSFRGVSGSSNYTATFILNISLNVGGGLILSPSMTLGNTGIAFNFNGSGTYNIVSNGKTVTTNFSFNNVGIWNFTDAFTITRVLTVSLGTINFTTNATLFTLTINNAITGNSGGTVNMNAGTITSSGNVNLSAGTLNVNTAASVANAVGVGILLSGTGVLNLNENTTTNRVTVTGGNTFTIASGKTLEITGSASTVPSSGAISFEISSNPNTTNFIGSTIKLTATNLTNQQAFYGNGLTYGTIWFSRGAATGTNFISGNNNINTLIDDGTAAHRIRFADSSTQTINTGFNVNGSSASARIILDSVSSTIASTFNLVYAGVGVVECNFLDVRYSSATPYTAPDDYTWYATGSLSTSVTGWSVVDNRYWVGGTGNWNVSANWSLLSGGAGSAGVPSSTISAVFDSNSGSGVVTITSGATCYQLNCLNFGGSFSGSNSLSVFQDAILGTSFASFTNILNLRMAGGRTNYLNTNNTTLASTIQINGSGFLLLRSNLNTTKQISHLLGTFDTKYLTTSYNVTCANYDNSSGNTTTLNMNSSTFTITSISSGFCWFAVNPLLTVNSGTSSIIITDNTNSNINFSGGGKTYYLVHFNRGASTGTIFAVSGGAATLPNTYNEFRDTGTAAHDIQWSTLGQTFNIFNVNGASSSAKITLTKQTLAGNYTFTSTNTGITYCENIIVNFCTASPAKKFYANATNSTIGTNTTGWNDKVGSFTLLGVG